VIQRGVICGAAIGLQPALGECRASADDGASYPTGHLVDGPATGVKDIQRLQAARNPVVGRQRAGLHRPDVIPRPL